MIIKTKQENKACPPPRNVGGRRGFVILFAVTLSSILLAIALGVANISLKEIKFSTSAEITNEAFFAADTAIERVLYNDRSGFTSYPPTPGAERSWSETITGVGSTGAGCAKVTITKNNINIAIPVRTMIISRGYNIGDASCNSTNPNRVEREIEVNY
ncbi:MAG: hypothetical protein WA060_00430 [Minisyncoccia bacterium]